MFGDSMENSGEEIINQLMQRAEEDAQRKSQQIRASMFCDPTNTENFHKPVNIFANSKKPQCRNLFGDTSKSVNLFQVQNQGGANLLKQSEQGAKNIFDTAQKPAIVENEEEKSLSEGSQSAVKSQLIFKTDPEVKVMKYEYKNQLQKIGQFSLRKFKNGVSPAKEEVYVTLEKSESNAGVLYIFIRNNATKISVYQGIMMKSISNPQHFMGKGDNIRFEIVKQNRNEQSGEGSPASKLVKELVKLQFISEQECDRFLKSVKDNL